MPYSVNGKSIIVIPCRMDSERLPGKPMIVVDGKPILHHVYDRARQTIADHAIIATPDREIGRYCEQHGLIWRPTREGHPTGTHRCGEIINQIKEDVVIDKVINWQCDEVEVEPEDVSNLLFALDRHYPIATLISEFSKSIPDNNVVKVAVSETGQALWFSRLPLSKSKLHCGVYAFWANSFQRISELPPTKLSRAESLEQIAWIEAGYHIDTVGISGSHPIAINTPKDLERWKRKVEDVG